MRIVGAHSSLELELAELGPPGTPADADLLVNVTVVAHGFSAADQSWIAYGDWQAFLAQLERLERDRQGSAVVHGASPDELRIELFSTGRAGHVAVRGHVRRPMPDGFKLALEFGFAFEPDQLPRMLDALRAFRP